MWCTMHARVYSWILICDFRIPGGARARGPFSLYECVRERCVLRAGLRVRVCVLSFVPSRIRALQGDV